MLHANKSAKRHFGQKNLRTGELEFSDLPQILGAKIYQVLKTGAAMGPFRYEPENSSGTIYNINVVPFQRGNATVPVSALLTAEDLTQTEQLRKLEVEAENLRLVKSMADRMAHEIGNTMVPLSTHQQLLAEKYDDKEFRESLDHALADGVKRVTRLVNQMRFLAREGTIEQQTFPVGKLIEEAYQEARKHQPGETAKLRYEKSAVLRSTSPATAPRSSTRCPKSCSTRCRRIRSRRRWTCGCSRKTAAAITICGLKCRTTAPASPPRRRKKFPSAFFTTRNVGLGLGLTVSRKIIETHHGKLEIVPPQSGQSGIVRVSLPLEPAGSTAS